MKDRRTWIWGEGRGVTADRLAAKSSGGGGREHTAQADQLRDTVSGTQGHGRVRSLALHSPKAPSESRQASSPNSFSLP